MRNPLFHILAASVLLVCNPGIASEQHAPASVKARQHANPLFSASGLPFHLPPFDRIKDAHFAPAFAEALRQDSAMMTRIANNPRPATFDNTVVAMERSGTMLERVSKTFFALAAANTNDQLTAIERDIAPKLAAHSDQVMLNEKLFKRIRTLHDKRGRLGLDAESKHLLERYYTDFVRAGAKLSDADKKTLKAYNAEMAALDTAFSQNVLKELNAAGVLVESRAELAGMPEDAIAAAAQAAKERGQDGKYWLAMVNTTGQPPVAQLIDRQLRRRLQESSMRRGSNGGEYDNRAVVRKLVKLRAQRAQLLGYPNYAAYMLEDETAQTPEAVNSLLAELSPPAVVNARKEAAAIQRVIDEEKGGFQLAAYDWQFFSEKVFKARYDFDESQLRPYFELNNVLTNGVFFAANQLYGLGFKQRFDLPVYHPDVRIYDVIDADGKPLAMLIMDLYARDNKRGGAWMNDYVRQSTLLCNLPLVANHVNIPKPPKGEATLLTLDDTVALFHEFGHALHGILSNVRYPRFSGTNVPRDFVEYPSQVNEMWAYWPEVLKNYAKHYQTGAPMPAALLEKVLADKTFNQGFATTEYLAAALLDQRWHQITPQQVPSDVLAFEAQALAQAGVDFAPVPPRYRTTYFSHSFGGYAAGYYAYLWSEKLDADTVKWFKENGGLSRKNGDWFRQQLLSRGGSIDAMTLYRNFRGRDAKIDALLERRGLVGAN